MSEGFISPGRSTAVVAQGRKPLTRPLQIYAFDPSLGRRHGNHTRVSVPHESLQGRPGPRGRRVEVIDYDASNDVYYEAVDLEDRDILLQGGLPPSEADPRFHQQMVYAVVMKTVETFKTALGRPMEWSRRGRKRPRPLRVFPHAMQEANAYYDPDRHALLFGYFTAQEADGALTGQTVFSCLSHDKEDEKDLQESLEGAADGVAFALDWAKNNTSLVLLFGCRGRSLLFPGDAQYGNWRSWMDEPTTAALLNDVSFLKVSHHGSANATPRSAVEGLSEGRFAAMVSTQTSPWPSIPRVPLMQSLQARSGQRLVRSDGCAPDGTALAEGAPLPESFSRNGAPPSFDYVVDV